MTSISASPAVATVPERRVPPLGGFSPTFLGLEIRRMLRNRRTLIFTVIVPPLFFFLFGGSNYSNQRVGYGNVSAYIMISLAVYGAMIATTAGGASVALERAAGWSRQLRLTPLNPLAYVATKLVTAMVLGAVSLTMVMIAGAVGGASMPIVRWVACALIAWACALVFAAFGLFMGYLLPSENVMQILGPVLAVLAFLGGLFIPLNQLGSTFQTIATFTPAYGVGELARIPLTHDAFSWAAVVNIVAWLALFVVGAALLFRRDTRRV